jgi:hypothetical protein
MEQFTAAETMAGRGGHGYQNLLKLMDQEGINIYISGTAETGSGAIFHKPGKRG